MTGFLTITIAIALLVPLVTGGSYRALVERPWKWQLTFAAGLVLQAVSSHLPSPGGHDLGFGALVASYVLLLGFCARNLIRTGMAVVLIGIAMNTVAIVANHGMPVDVPQRWATRGGLETTVKHHELTNDDTVRWLSDLIYLPLTDEVISFGDLVIAVGLIDVSFHASRSRSRKRTRTRTVAASNLGAGPASIDLVHDAELDARVVGAVGIRSAAERNVATTADHVLERVDH